MLFFDLSKRIQQKKEVRSWNALLLKIYKKNMQSTIEKNEQTW